MQAKMTPFNRPHLTGKEMHYIYDAVYTEGQLAGNGKYTKACQQFFEEKYGFGKCLLTTSCTDALEMCALLLELKEGDEIILPSYTFPSTATAFALRGATLRFADSSAVHPNIDPKEIEQLITPQTKAIVVVHYAGVACDMDAIMDLAQQHNLIVIEDAAQAVDSCYKGRPLGSIGHLAAFSFHETKNIISGEGGMLVINKEKWVERAEILWEKGTNRAAFFRGEVDKYRWVDIGSSFLPSELTAAFLFAQLEALEDIQQQRMQLWQAYWDRLSKTPSIGGVDIQLPLIPEWASNNANMFYVLCNTAEERDLLIQYMASLGLMAVFHYQTLHSSPYYRNRHDGRLLPHANRFADCLLRMPFHLSMDITQISQLPV